MEASMISITLANREVTYLITALSNYQRQLLESVGEEMGDEYDDLLVVGHLIKRLNEAEKDAGI